MKISQAYSLTAGTKLNIDEHVVFFNPPIFYYWPTTGLRFASPGILSVFKYLAETGGTQAQLETLITEQDGERGLASLSKWLANLDNKALLSRTLLLNNQPLMTLQPISPLFRYIKQTIDARQFFQLSRFAFARKHEGELIFESSQGHAIVQLHVDDDAAILFQRLVNPVTLETLMESMQTFNHETVAAILDFMLNALIIKPVIESELGEHDDPVLESWAFHDMLFHVRSRLGRHALSSGGYYAQTDHVTPPPIVKPMMSNELIPLYKPDIVTLKENDLPLSQVLETRASVRKYGKTPIDAVQLGEFLYRTARIKKLIADAGLSFRPYAGCGGIYGLEIYPIINQCDGIAHGIYHYDPLDHQLIRLGELNTDIQKLLRIAVGTALVDDEPQILLIITARFQRTQTKYRHTAYSMILQEVGSLYQTMYLVAHAMKLAPVALGGGYSDLFSQSIGLDHFQESSVGEFLIGSLDVKDNINKAMAEGGVFVEPEDSKGGFGKGVIIKGNC